MEIFECRILWYGENGYTEIVDYLESRRGDVMGEFVKLHAELIKEAKRKYDKEVESFNNIFN